MGLEALRYSGRYHVTHVTHPGCLKVIALSVLSRVRIENHFVLPSELQGLSYIRLFKLKRQTQIHNNFPQRYVPQILDSRTIRPFAVSQ